MEVVPIATSGPLLAALAVAMLAGLVSFFAPCMLPLVPGYLAYVTGLAGADLANPSQPRTDQTGGAASRAMVWGWQRRSPRRSWRRRSAASGVVMGLATRVAGCCTWASEGCRRCRG